MKKKKKKGKCLILGTSFLCLLFPVAYSRACRLPRQRGGRQAVEGRGSEAFTAAAWRRRRFRLKRSAAGLFIYSVIQRFVFLSGFWDGTRNQYFFRFSVKCWFKMCVSALNKVLSFCLNRLFCISWCSVKEGRDWREKAALTSEEEKGDEQEGRMKKEITFKKGQRILRYMSAIHHVKLHFFMSSPPMKHFDILPF